GIPSQMSVIVTAGFLLGWRGCLAIGLVTMGTDLGLAYMEMTGSLPEPSVIHTTITRWISAIIPFATIFSLQYYAMRFERSSIEALEREIAYREESEREKDQIVSWLGERVKELKPLYAISRILQNEDR